MQRRVQRAARDCLSGEVRSGCKLCEADEDPAEKRHLSRYRDPRREDDRSDYPLCPRREDSCGRLRISDALRSAPRLAARIGEARLAHEGLHPLRHRMVSVFHAATGGTSGERIVYCEEFIQKLIPIMGLTPLPMAAGLRCIFAIAV